MRYIASFAALIITYLVVSFSYAELIPPWLHSDLFKDRPHILGFRLFVEAIDGKFDAMDRKLNLIIDHIVRNEGEQNG